MSQVFPGFHKKLARTKIKQSTDKASKHNRSTVFSCSLVFLPRASTGVVSSLSYHLYSFSFTSSLLAPTPHFRLLYASERSALLRHGVYTLWYVLPFPRWIVSPLQSHRICGNASLLFYGPPLCANVRRLHSRPPIPVHTLHLLLVNFLQVCRRFKSRRLRAPKMFLGFIPFF